MKCISYVIAVIFLAVSSNAFWWGSSNSRSNENEEDEIKRVPFHVIRTLTYHPVLIPSPQAPPMPAYQYARGYFPPANLPQQTYTQSPPSPQPITTTRARTTPAPTTTTTSTTPEPSTTPQHESQMFSQGSPFKQAAKSSVFSDPGFEYSPASSFSQSKPSDGPNLQYVTNIAPMNVQFVPCMCPVEVRISSQDSQHDKQSEDAYVTRDLNTFDENLD